VAVLLCAGAYVSSAAGSNECPAGSGRIETEAACRAAAAAAGKTPSTSTSSPFVVTRSNRPRGCYYVSSTDTAYFNTDAVGAGTSIRLLCAAATAGAPPPMRAAALRVCAAATVRRCGVGTCSLCVCAE
jgi:hypothetical protein